MKDFREDHPPITRYHQLSIPDSIIIIAMNLTPLLMTALVSVGVGDSSSTIYLSAPGIQLALPHFLMAEKGAPTGIIMNFLICQKESSFHLVPQNQEEP
jgi:hypothetical protein